MTIDADKTVGSVEPKFSLDPDAPRRSASVLAMLSAFRRREEGSVTIFSLFLIVVMLMIGGMAVDLMRYETQRARLLATADRAVLAAAALGQTNDPTAVVQSYFDAAGLANANPQITYTTAFGAKEVSVTAESSIATHLMDLLGHKTLTVPASSTAAEGVTHIEISLVLDVSGSMGQSSATAGLTKLAALQDAAGEFVDIVYSREAADEVSTSVIPYSTQVNAGELLLDNYNVAQIHDFSHCVNFESGAFDTTALSTSASLEQTGHFDPWRNWGPLYGLDGDGNPDNPAWVCLPYDWAEIQPFIQDPELVKDQINAFEAGGNTSIDIGMKWGSALLDPGTNGVVQNLVSSGDVVAQFADRPREFGVFEYMKVIVLMTDGINTSQYYLEDEFRSGDSNIFYDNASERYSVYQPEEAVYNSELSTCSYTSGPGGGWSGTNCTMLGDIPGAHVHDSNSIRYTSDDVDDDNVYYENFFIPHQRYNGESDYFRRWVWNTAGYGQIENLTWPEVFANMSLYYQAYRNRYAQVWRASDFYDYWSGEVFNYVGAGTKNDRLSRICTEAKDQGIIVYTIGFEVTPESAVIMQNCASSPSHYFDVEGTEISAAFVNIARQINELSLIK